MIAEAKSGIDLLNSSLALISKIQEVFKFANPEGRNIEFSYLAQEMEVSMLLSIPSGYKRWGKDRIHLNFPEIKGVALKNLPIFTDSKAILRTDQGYYLDVKNLGDYEQFLLIVKHNAPPALLRDLISVQNSNVPMNTYDGIEEYWLSVALKKRELLKRAFKEGFNIYGFENHFTINIHNSVATTIPNKFVDRLKNITKFIHETDREGMRRIVYERLRYQKEKKKQEDERKLIMDLRNSFCTSNAFLKFIKVDNPFICKEAIQGQNYFDGIPFDIFPKAMDVVSTTNINFDNPTAEGKLYFKKTTFEDEIQNFFEEHGYIK